MKQPQHPLLSNVSTVTTIRKLFLIIDVIVVVKSMINNTFSFRPEDVSIILHNNIQACYVILHTPFRNIPTDLLQSLSISLSRGENEVTLTYVVQSKVRL